ncbi:MAG TPA: tetratricopeptide repeat protein, partial [Candidatus Eisenbacteria bacterium]
MESGDGSRTLPVGFKLALLAAFAAMLWMLRTRTHFLGDGMIWLYGLRVGDLSAPTEPLAQAIWQTASMALRQLGAPVVSSTLATVSIACGVLAAVLLWGIAREITAGRGGFATAFPLLLTLGTTQLFCGYIESYPLAAVAILAYLFAGLRCLRRERGLLLPVLAFAVAVASHLLTLYLLPSLVFLIFRGQRSPLRRVALIGLAVALSASFLVLLGSGPAQWIHAFDLATRAARVGPAASTVKPYEIVSLGHAVDLANAILLVVPVPLLLLLARAAERRGRGSEADPTGAFLGIAGGAGLLGALALVLPVAPAQDWDLTSLLLLPLGVFGIWAGRPLYASGGKLFRIGAVSLSLGALLAFVLVNASGSAGTRRYETLVSPPARITDFARWYGYELLAHYHRHRGENRRAMTYVDLLLRTEPANPRYWAMGGATLVGMGRYAEAVPFLTEALRRSPNRAGTRTNLGICYSDAGRYREALHEFQEAVRIDGNR